MVCRHRAHCHLHLQGCLFINLIAVDCGVYYQGSVQVRSAQHYCNSLETEKSPTLYESGGVRSPAYPSFVFHGRF
jgi:hypothetical protein